jgi:hypothetical protein
MDEKRHSPRARTLKTGRIAITEKAPKIECTVRNISATGACLQVSTTYGLPSGFELILEGAKHVCRVVWRTDTRLGVTFHA